MRTFLIISIILFMSLAGWMLDLIEPITTVEIYQPIIEKTENQYKFNEHPGLSIISMDEVNYWDKLFVP